MQMQESGSYWDIALVKNLETLINNWNEQQDILINLNLEETVVLKTKLKAK